MIVSQPANVTTASPRVSARRTGRQSQAPKRRGRRIGAAHMRDEQADGQQDAHTRSIPSISIEQDRERDDPENDGYGVHGSTMRATASRPRDNPSNARNDFMTAPASGERRAAAAEPQARSNGGDGAQPSQLDWRAVSRKPGRRALSGGRPGDGDPARHASQHPPSAGGRSLDSDGETCLICSWASSSCSASP